MRRLSFILTICCLVAIQVQAQYNYPVAYIPDALKTNANVVVRESTTLIDIDPTFSVREHYKIVYTILNSNGDDDALIYIPYDEDRKVKNVKANVYDARGLKLENIGKNDIYDQSYSDGSFEVTDSRIKIIDLRQKTYPYTVEVKFEIAKKYIYQYRSWFPIEGEHTAVQKSTYTVHFPPGLEPRIFSKNIGDPVKGQVKEKSSYSWSVANLMAMESQSLAPPLTELYPYVRLAPSNISMDKRHGAAESWKTFGQWFYELNKNRDDLSTSSQAKVRSLIDGATTEREKIKTIYEYLQNNTRYVSVQLGIGGLQTFEADFVDQNRWGDCKSLTNYTKAMLKVAGIPSYFALVEAGKNARKVEASFPSDQFNHVILCVPQKQDTIWLECTSQKGPFGYMGNFTGDRNVLVVNESGGHLVRTPVYAMEENTTNRTVDIAIDADGMAKIKVEAKYQALEYEDLGMNFAIHQSADKQKKWLYKKLQLNNAKINSFKLEQKGEEIPVGIENIDLEIRNFAKVSGKRFYFEPNVFNKIQWIPPKSSERIHDIVLKTDWQNKDVVNISVPENISPEYIPEPIAFTSAFGTYEMSIENIEGSLVYTRKITINKGSYDKSLYPQLIDFYKKIKKSDKSKVVFLKKT